MSNSFLIPLPEASAFAAGLDANMRGDLDVKAWNEGEFTTPLYTAAQVRTYAAKEVDAALAALKAQRMELQSERATLLERLANAGVEMRRAVAEERERCAKLCEEWASVRSMEHGGLALLNVAERIRGPKTSDAELEKQTGEPHIDGWPLYSGLPPKN